MLVQCGGRRVVRLQSGDGSHVEDVIGRRSAREIVARPPHPLEDRADRLRRPVVRGRLAALDDPLDTGGDRRDPFMVLLMGQVALCAPYLSG